MAKSKRVGRAAPTRAGSPFRPRTPEDIPAREDAPRRSVPRSAVETPRDLAAQAVEGPRDDGLDEWLAPDEDGDADLDQWLHDHGKDGGTEGPNS